MTGSLDTNIVLRLIMGDVPKQAAAAANLLDSCDSAPRVSDAVFVEVEYALRMHYHMNRQQTAELIDDISNQAISCHKALLADVLAEYCKHANISFVDIYLTLQAEKKKASPLYTFDQNLAKHLSGAELLS